MKPHVSIARNSPEPMVEMSNQFRGLCPTSSTSSNSSKSDAVVVIRSPRNWYGTPERAHHLCRPGFRQRDFAPFFRGFPLSVVHAPTKSTHFRRGRKGRVDDALVTGAATQVAPDRLTHTGLGRVVR